MDSLGRRTTQWRTPPQGILGLGAGGAAPPMSGGGSLATPPPDGNYGTLAADLPQHPQMQATPYQPFQPPNPPTFQPRDPGQFTGSAPTPTTYGDFVAPNPADVANDPYFKFRAGEGQKAIQASAAARGTLLSGGTLKSLEQYRQGLASEEAGKAFNRALQAYGENRATNAQNYGQQMGQFQGNLGAFGANTNATLGYNTQGMGAAYGNYDRAYDAARDIYGDQTTAAREQTDVANANAAQTYADQLAQARARLRAR